MDTRIKFIHALTICVILAFASSQAYWLYDRYVLTLQEHEERLFAAIVAAAEEDLELRREHPVLPSSGVITQQHYSYTHSRMESRSDSVTRWNLSVGFGVPASTFGADTLGVLNEEWASLQDSLQKYHFEIACAQPFNSVQTDRAVKLFEINTQNPFTTERLDSLLRRRDIAALRLTVDTLQDSLLWEPALMRHTSLLRPRIVVTCPIDILQQQVVRVETAVPLPPLLRSMGYTLAGSALLSLLLVFCLVYQILTIRKQRHIEAIRREFLYTMIHELKRPISTLKMCVSFMGNERMMQNAEDKQRILTSSHQELDNLTSYFSKLRDITLSDAAEIPLVKSHFPLRALIEECISKQNPPSGKEVQMEIVVEEDLEVRADRMHLTNILCNLLENAIKYSTEAVTVWIDYRMRTDGLLQITVADNGIGIARGDQRYVFDKFFRSEAAKAMPGIGLGLSYVKLLVEAHGGTISFESTEGKGTTFTILIPQTHGKD